MIMVMMIKIVKVFTQHQQKMAEILNRSAADQSEISVLRKELYDLKALVNDQVIAVDGRRSMSVSGPPPAPNLSERLSAGQ